LAEGGGGIACWDSVTAIIKNNIISNNHGNYGSGIWCLNSSPTIIENIIFENMGISGGGLYLRIHSKSLVERNIIVGNSVTSYGGGIVCFDSSSPLILNNLICGNSADRGGGIFCHRSNPVINNCVLSINSASDYGGGIYCQLQPSPQIINSIIWLNTASMGGNGVFINSDWISYPNISYSSIQDTLWPGGGNISSDPFFKDPEFGDFHLMSIACGDSVDSPCIDTGDPAIIDSLLDCSWGLGGLRGDMGAYGGGDSTIVENRIINVPGDYPTIQLAINASIDGDTVLVQPGTYVENVNFTGYDIVLGSLFLTTGDTSYISTTIIDGDSAGNVITFVSSEDSTAELVGFTVQNGYDIEGGGILCNNSRPIIRDNIIVHNSTSGIRCQFNANPVIRNNVVKWNTVGAGIYCRDHSHPEIIYNTISENTAGRGGGIYIRNGVGPTVSNNLIINNVAQGSNYGQGGGIYCYAASPIINENLIADNTVYSALGHSSGGGIYCKASIPLIADNILRGNLSGNNIGIGGAICLEDCEVGTVRNNRIFDNYAGAIGGDGGDGGGICLYESSPLISFNLIQGNSATRNGGGIYSSPFSWPDMRNNTIIANSASNGGGNYLYRSYLTIANTIFWNNTAEYGEEIYVDQGSPIIIYCNISGGWPGAGNIDSDPLFCFPDTLNYWLAEDSPCVEAGCDSLGNPDTTYDIGAYGIGCDDPTDILASQLSVPNKFSISQNYPNPFNSSTTIKYDLPKAGRVSIKVYDLLGRKVETLVDEDKQAGQHSAIWDASAYSSGVYFYRIKAGDFTQTRKMILLK
jgi:parallel beta-helix repeat protein